MSVRRIGGVLKGIARRDEVGLEKGTSLMFLFLPHMSPRRGRACYLMRGPTNIDKAL
jgi:hypothetical protein